MSTQLGLWDSGLSGPEDSADQRSKRASLGREILYLLTISTNAGGRGAISPAGVAYSLGVCLIEDSNMARGAGKGGKPQQGGALPRFVDVKLTAEQRKGFVTWEGRDANIVALLQAMADSGYRVGVAWSGEQQAYTTSLTCRDAGSPNNGLCMTSFARDVETALWLALYKHFVVTGEKWLEGGFGGEEDFG